MSTLVTLLSKTGVAGTTGANTNALPTSDNADAKGNTTYQGLHLHNKFEVAFTRSTQDGSFALEATMDGTNYSRVAFRRMDNNVVISGALALGASATFLVALPNPTDDQRILGLRPVCWLAGAGAAGDVFVVKVTEGR